MFPNLATLLRDRPEGDWLCMAWASKTQTMRPQQERKGIGRGGCQSLKFYALLLIAAAHPLRGVAVELGPPIAQ